MLTVGPDGGLVEIPAFHSAAISLLKSIGAKNFTITPTASTPPGAAIALVIFDSWYDGAFGRSPDEAVLRVIEQIVNDKVDCKACNRPSWVSVDDVLSPVTPEARNYLLSAIDQVNHTCTLYFDHRDVSWKQSCRGYDPDITPADEGGDEDGAVSLLRP